MSHLIATIENEPILLDAGGRVYYHAKAAIDCDGTGPHYGDPDAQSETSLKWNGTSLNADEDRYIVVPPAIIRGVGPVVLGCRVRVTNEENGKSTLAVVGDVGPHTKLGEISRATAIALGIDPSPTSGGMDAHHCFYEIWPGVAAVVDGKEYHLQPS